MLHTQKKSTQRKQSAPKEYVNAVTLSFELSFFSVRDECGKDSYDIPVCYPVFGSVSVITADNIVLIPHLKYPVKDIFSVIPFVKRDIISLKSSGRLLNDKKVSPLADERFHAVTDIGVDQSSVALYDLLEA